MICPKCMRQFEDGVELCTEDGTPLRAFRDQATHLVGRTLDGRWLIEDKIGEGGMGEVYRARQLNVERVVAVKVLRMALASTEQYVARFFREANIATTVQHPHFVTIHDFGQSDEERVLYIAMELLEGFPLSDALKKSRLPLLDCLEISSQVCAAMSAAHAAKIVHRDLKPDNIFLLDVPEGGPFTKVLDFGIAKDLDSNDGVTRTGQIFGTPEYMSPEQCEGNDKVDGRSDLYALGCILYEMLAGRSPFQRESVIQTLMAQVADDPIPFAELGLPVPAAVEDIVMRLLEKRQDHRFATAIDARTALQNAIDSLRRDDDAVGAYELVSASIPLRAGHASTVSYQELGHPLQLEGVLASSAKSALAREADRKRREDVERDTEPVPKDVDPSRVGMWVLLAALVGAAAFGGKLIVDARDTPPPRPDATIPASVTVVEAVTRARNEMYAGAAASAGRIAAGAVALRTVAAAAVASSASADPTPPSTRRPRKHDDPRSSGALDQHFRRKHAALRSCYQSRDAAEEEGEVTFKLRIDADGTISEVDVSSDGIRSGAVLDCMKQAVASLRFDAAELGANYTKAMKFRSGH